MLHRTICEDLPSVTSSPGSESGHILCVWPDGRITNRSGQEVARASLSARQVKAMDLLTSGTYGHPSITLSMSASLSTSLASRLQQVTQMHGSTLYKQTWKEWGTPSGLCRFRLRASVRRISESALTGWPTPTANTNPQPETKRGLQTVPGAARLTGWPTPIAGDSTGGPRPADEKRGPAPGLQSASILAGWPTPTATNNDRSPSIDRAMSMWRPDGTKAQQRLQDFAGICGPLRLTVFGEMQTGSFVEMESGVQLNPAHSRWLQGLPKAWDTASPHYEQWQAATEPDDLRVTATL